jgi:hypothetical protein
MVSVITDVGIMAEAMNRELTLTMGETSEAAKPRDGY